MSRRPQLSGPVGASTSGRGAFDRAPLHKDFRLRGKADEKQKVVHAFFSRVPTVYQVFSWAEKEEGPIEDERLEAVGEALVTLDRDGATSRRSTQQCGVSS